MNSAREAGLAGSIGLSGVSVELVKCHRNPIHHTTGTFNPTNRSIGGFNLVPVAVGRHIRQVVPVSGSFVGMTDAFAAMSVDVRVT
jgi:hypothetical protein